jgi:hypothetical protein
MASMTRIFGFKGAVFAAIVSSLLGTDIVAQDPYSIDCSIPQSWVQAEYLMGWIKDGPNGVPLISRGSTLDPRPAALGQPGTTVLAGGSPIDFGTLEGGRLTFGRWRDTCQTIGWELSGFYMEQSDIASSFSSQEGDAEVVTAPIQLPDGTESSISALVNTPGAPSPFETLTARYQSRLAGGHANLVSNSFRTCCASWDTLLGFRLLNLEEATSLNADISRTVAGGKARTLGEDLFETDATFYGTSLGWRGERYGRRWVLSGRTGFSLGLTENRVEVSGYRTQINPGAAPVTTAGFVFSEPTNLGSEKHTHLSVVPEGSLQGSYWLTRRLSLGIGYSALYWNNVVRPGHQIDRVVNPTQRSGGVLVGDPRPASQFNRTDLWFHAASFGLTYRW